MRPRRNVRWRVGRSKGFSSPWSRRCSSCTSASSRHRCDAFVRGHHIEDRFCSLGPKVPHTDVHHDMLFHPGHQCGRVLGLLRGGREKTPRMLRSMDRSARATHSCSLMNIAAAMLNEHVESGPEAVAAEQRTATRHTKTGAEDVEEQHVSVPP